MFIGLFSLEMVATKTKEVSVVQKTKLEMATESSSLITRLGRKVQPPDWYTHFDLNHCTNVSWFKEEEYVGIYSVSQIRKTK